MGINPGSTSQRHVFLHPHASLVFPLSRPSSLSPDTGVLILPLIKAADGLENSGRGFGLFLPYAMFFYTRDEEASRNWSDSCASLSVKLLILIPFLQKEEEDYSNENTPDSFFFPAWDPTSE